MAITYLGGAASQSAGGACTITLGVGVTTSQGIIVLAAIDTNSNPVAPTDTAGNTYTRDDAFSFGGVIDIAVFSCLTPTALSVGNTITLSGSLGSQRQAWHAYKFDNPIAFDGTGGTSNGEGRGTGTAVSDNLQPLTTANANDCLFGAVLADTASTLTGVTAGWNAASTPSVTTDTNLRLFGFSQVVSATGTYPLSGTLGTSSNWEVVNAGYKYTAGGGTTYTKTGAGVAKLYATGARVGGTSSTKLGDTNVEASSDQWPEGYVAAYGVGGGAGGYQMPSAGTLQNININLIGGSGDITVLPALYNDSSLSPGSLFCTFDAITVPAGAAAAWYQSGNPTATTLVNGNKYWLGFIVSNQPGSAVSVTCKTAGAAANSAYYNNTGGTTIPSPFPASPSTFAEVASIYINYTSGSGTVYTKSGAGVAKLYASGVRGGHLVWLKKGAGVAKLYAAGAKAYITSGFLTTTMPVVPFRQQASNAAYAKTGAGVAKLYATGAKQYLIGGTGTLYQKTGAGTARGYTTGDSENVYASSGAAVARLYVTGTRTGGTIPPPPTPPLYVLRDAVFTVAGFDLSNHVDSVEVLIHQDMIDITKYGDTAIHYTLGLRTDQITCTFIQDFGLSTVHSVISNLLTSSGFTVTAKPRTGVTAVTNPLYSATCIVTSYTPLSAKVGDRSDAPVVFQAISPITQATS